MCGIAGAVGLHHRERCRDATKAIVHRGPDDEGFFDGNGVSIGMRRLSIVDVAGGHQPIESADGELVLVCNGEIYNSPELRASCEKEGYPFKSRSDVEVILPLYRRYGLDCVKHLRGMFAFALWDKEKERLLLARDHMGQKPLFYAQQEGAFVFGSEVKSILASGMVAKKPDLAGLWHYMSLRYLPDSYTLFEGVQKLPAAHGLVWERGQVSTFRYWQPDFNSKLDVSEPEIVDRLDTLLKDTVRGHLLSDVPVGAFLSGGIDSSLITAMMAESGLKGFPTFSIGVKEQGFNELPWARMVSQKYGLDAHEKIVEADMIHLIPKMIHHLDEPSDPFAAGVYLVSGVAADHVKVVLGGDGGDENFAGYDRYAGNHLVDFYCLMPESIRRSVMHRIFRMVPESFGYKSVAQKLRWLNEMSFYKGGERYSQSMSVLRFTQQGKAALFTANARDRIADSDSCAKILEYYNSPVVSSSVDRMLYTDLMTRMPDHLLMITDRMSMAHSIEGRSPLIDYRVVEFAASVPGDIKLKGRQLKYLLKKVAARYLPDELIHRKKQGFGFPLALWMRGELKGFLQNLLQVSCFVENGLFERNELSRIVNEHLSGKVDHNFRLWIWINLEIWYRMYFENESVESMQSFVDTIR